MAKERRSLHGKVVAITGGARGIGKATATTLVRKGCRVALGDIDLELAEQTAEALGGGTVAIQLDVTDRGSFSTFLDQAERQLGGVDVLINNAGIMPLGRFAEEDDATAHRMVDINIHGVILGTKLALARMEPRNTGHIVNIASQAGKAGFPGGATYCATKHAVVGLCEAVRAELDGTEIEVHCVMPGVVNTDAIAEALETGRFEVWVPRSTKAINTMMGFVPRRGREAIARGFKADKILAEPNQAERAAYEERAAKTPPSQEASATKGAGEESGAEKVSAKD